MGTTDAQKRVGLPLFNDRIAGALYLVSVLTAVLGEFFLGARLGVVTGVIVPISCYAAVMVLLYPVFAPVSARLMLLAVLLGLAGLTLEMLPWRPGGINIGMVFHGLYCGLVGYLMIRSTFLPRFIGALMAFGGLCWLTNLWPPLASGAYARITAIGLLGEGLPMLWLLIAGVDVRRWREKANLH